MQVAEIDWQKLYTATSTSNAPTPGWLFNEIVHNVSHASPADLPGVATYLGDCVDGDHAHVKLKALFVIKTLAYRVPPFCRCMQERLSSCQEAAVFTGPPSETYGDEPYRLVREAAEGAVAALTGGEFYHEQYREMSQRIVGFGNYQPDDDTVLPDGDINVGRDVTYTDVASTAIGYVSSGVGSLLWGVKDVFASPFTQKKGDDVLGVDDDDEDADPFGTVDDACTRDERDEPLQGVDEDGGYQPSAGSYCPPFVPPAPPTCTQEPAAVEEELFEDSVAAACLDDLVGDVLGEPITEQPPATGEPDGDLSEAAILDILGLGPGSVGEAAAPPQRSAFGFVEC